MPSDDGAASARAFRNLRELGIGVPLRRLFLRLMPRHACRLPVGTEMSGALQRRILVPELDAAARADDVGGVYTLPAPGLVAISERQTTDEAEMGCVGSISLRGMSASSEWTQLLRRPRPADKRLGDPLA